MSALASFHPAVRAWFERRFPEGPTEPQAAGWPAIASGEDTLIAAPTGSGKTLAAFLVAIDRLLRERTGGGGGNSRRDVVAAGPPLHDTPRASPEAVSDGPSDGRVGRPASNDGARPPAADAAEGTRGAVAPDDDAVEVVYVSPLKALAADIQQNLQVPLAEIRATAAAMGLDAPELRVLLRTGDTASSARAAMVKRPPHLLVTTPESLYLMVTAGKSRERLKRVRAVIVDEIHAVARDKRGAHLALTLARLDALCERRPQRIGLSATQRPIEAIARLLVGVGEGRTREDGAPACRVVDLGHRRALDLAIELPPTPLEAVISHEQWAEILDQIAGLVAQHRTTLIFVNTRRLAERLAHLLAERLGDDRVAAHHGSLSKERRLVLESRLRAGDLKALVATASLELGIDIGPVELVCQIGSPRSLATFLQRVGRSGHARGATPKGRLYPTTRDELVEGAALLRGILAGKLDRVLPPAAPLDILAQHVVAACVAEAWREDDLYALVRRAAHYAELDRADFDAVVEMLAEGIQTGRGRRGAWLHRDRVNGVLRARRAARLAALTSGGAIPETADYKVVADPDDTVVGTVNEDWAIESMAGDIFLLGSTSWRIRRVEAGVVRVTDAQGAPPSVPFWLGEAPARTQELSAEVSDLRARFDVFLAQNDTAAARVWLESECGISGVAAAEITGYLAAARAGLGVLPTQRDVVFERFFDETGGMQLVIHAPFGGRINRALGLALRKRFCRRFDFELQAAASDDAVVLSLSPGQSLPLEEVPRFLTSRTAAETLAQALLLSPMFQVRWRWNLGRALMVLRQRGSRRNPPPIQRMEADDLMAAVFPALAGCQENAAAGPVDIPEHPIVRQTMHDCLHEATDVDGLVALLEGIEAGRVRPRFVDSAEPSPLSHEILNGRPYTYLDDAPLEERRTRAVALRRGLPESARELGRLDPAAIARVRDEARPDPRDAEELHDTLLGLVIARPQQEWAAWFDDLVRQGRAASATSAAGTFWIGTEQRPALDALFPGAAVVPDVRLPAVRGRAAAAIDQESAAVEVARGHLATMGPATAVELAERTGLTVPLAEQALAKLELEGFALRGRFDSERSDATAVEFCERRLLARIHRYTTERLRREIEPVTAQDFMRFLLRWQHVAPDTQVEGRRGVLAVVEQLQGFEVAAGSWEETVLPSRIASYRPEWLDDLCLSGEVMWGRLASRGAGPEVAVEAGPTGRGGAVPSRATPVSFAVRDNSAWLLRAARSAEPLLPGEGAARDVLEALRTRGALFYNDLVGVTARLRVEVEEGLWDLVSRGLVTADGFGSVRALLTARERWAKRAARSPRGRRLRRSGREVVVGAEGRWSLLLMPSAPDDAGDVDSLAEAVAEQLLARWGVVFRDLWMRENLAIPWRHVLWALRRMEARGTARGGRFVTGFVGEQYALPEAVEALRQTRRRERTGETVRIAAVDPLNLTGVITPGPRVPAVRGNVVIYRDGLPVSAPAERLPALAR